MDGKTEDFEETDADVLAFEVSDAAL